MILHRFEEVLEYPRPTVILTTDGNSLDVKTFWGHYVIRKPDGDIRIEQDDASRPLIKEFLQFADRMRRKYAKMWELLKATPTPIKKNRRSK